MNALKRIIVLGVVFFIGFSFVAFGKITYRDTTTEIRNITNSNKGKTDKKEQELFIYKERTWVPIRFISESMGKYIEWNGTTNTIDIWNQKPESKTLPSEEGKNEIAFIVPVLEKIIIEYPVAIYEKVNLYHLSISKLNAVHSAVASIH
jgi:hypothetical protein